MSQHREPAPSGASSRTRALPLLLVLTALLSCAASGVAGDSHHESDPPQFFVSCADGQKPTDNSVPCDVDDHADGTCTFGERGGEVFRVKVGQTKNFVNSCDVLTSFTCDPPVAIPPKIVELEDPSKPAKPKRWTSPHYSAHHSPGQCGRDSDCVPTSGNGCVARSDFPDLEDPNNVNVRCMCMKGPRFLGCVPRGTNWESFGRRLNR